MTASRKSKKEAINPQVTELENIKKLLILQLVTSGVQGTVIASVLGVHKSLISRLVPTRKVKRALGR